jgi:hypothetical protein
MNGAEEDESQTVRRGYWQRIDGMDIDIGEKRQEAAAKSTRLQRRLIKEICGIEKNINCVNAAV